jgi:hypothetical protein
VRRLAVPLQGLTSGRARLEVRAPGEISGRTAWKLSRIRHGTVAEGVLDAQGMELLLGESAGGRRTAAGLSDLDAVTVVSLGGTAVTRVTVRAIPDESGVLELSLPPGAFIWKAFVGGSALRATEIAKGGRVRIPLKGASEVELSYTLELPPMGLRGHYRVELPKLSAPVQGARWSVFLPAGLRYSEMQSALTAASCEEPSRSRTPMETEGICYGFTRAALQPSAPFVEGRYEQAM